MRREERRGGRSDEEEGATRRKEDRRVPRRRGRAIVAALEEIVRVEEVLVEVSRALAHAAVGAGRDDDVVDLA